MPRSKGTSSSRDLPAAAVGAGLLVVNGWRIGFHAELLLQLEKLISAVEQERRQHPERRPRSQPAQILAALRQLMFVDVPQEPGRSIYRHGGTLGKHRKHWFRAKFGNGRYRLFFRYRLSDRVLIFAWVNDQETLRTYGSSTDAYAVFARMLGKDNPPDDWDALLKACTSPETIERFNRILARLNLAPPD
ncbi:MAG TPA: type II toxin-antitoxin system YhaV family toxin [Longimicrobium sp.]